MGFDPRASLLCPLLLAMACGVQAGTMDCNDNGIDDADEFCLDCDDNGLLDSCEAAAGTGLVGQYWLNDGAGEFVERVGARVDPVIDFGFSDPPFPGLESDNFNVRWTGTVTTTAAAGPYRFFTLSDDGVRLWVDGELLIDQWGPQSPTEWFGDITLDANSTYLIRLDYQERQGGQEARLSWRPPGDVKVIIPTDALGPVADVDGNDIPDVCDDMDCNDNGVADSIDVAMGTSLDCNDNCTPDECDVMPTDPLGYWRFEDPGTPALDSSPNMLPGAAVASELTGDVPVAVVPRTTELNDMALDLGGDGYLVVDDGGLLDMGDTSFTIEAWVRIDELSDTSGNGQRQYLIQKKILDDPGGQLDYGVLAQRGNLSGGVNFGKDQNFSGRELLLLFGDGGNGAADTWSVTSFLEINDTNWHYVTVSFDAFNGEVRFGLDGNFETIIVADQGHVATGGPLLVGAHTNASGNFNQFLRGAIDEVRISAGVLPIDQLLFSIIGTDCNDNGIPDECELADGTAEDCDGDGLLDECEQDCNNNGEPDGCDIIDGISIDCDGNGVPDECQADDDCDNNGVPDECDIAAGAADCNSNGAIDSCDIAAGISEDCDADGIPDECQLQETVVLAYDDGGPEVGVRADQAYTSWLTRFNAPPGTGVVDAIDVMFVLVPTGTDINVYVWSDPNGDGDPTDATVLWSNSITIQATNSITRIQVPQIAVGDAGASFFLGFILPDPPANNEFPAALDVSGAPPVGRSWLIGSNSPIQPNDLANGAIEFRPIEEILFGGSWVIRAVLRDPGNDCNDNAVPDQCDIDDGLLDDIDGNGVPDTCEDCNDNGIPDSLDIDGGSSDCNGDRVPDECQVFSNDCDGNDVPDICQLTDNDCNDNGILDPCDIISGFSEDENANGVPDECEDCNRNGRVDSVDIDLAISDDCNEDGVPDECQLGDAIEPVPYQIDDGTKETNVGFVSPADMVWLNRFIVQPGGEIITAFEVLWANTFAGQPAEVVLWRDPNGDGNPTDAQVIQVTATETANVNTNIFNTVTIPPTFVGAAGTSFFAGIHLDDVFNTAPAAADNSDPDGESWLGDALNGTLDLNDLAGAFISPWQDDFIIHLVGSDGSLVNDCNSNVTLDECDIDSGKSNDVDGNGTPDECECPGDANGDSFVDVQDLVEVVLNWGVCGAPCDADSNGDGVVNVVDLVNVILNWGICESR